METKEIFELVKNALINNGINKKMVDNATEELSNASIEVSRILRDAEKGTNIYYAANRAASYIQYARRDLRVVADNCTEMDELLDALGERNE